MLDDLRQLMKQRWRRRARIYLVTAGALSLAMTTFGFDPIEQAASGAPTWLALAIGGLALVTRTVLPGIAPRPSTMPPVSRPLATQNRHDHDLMARNLHARVGNSQVR